MKKTHLFSLLLYLFAAFGCGISGKFKSETNPNQNIPTPTPTAETKPTATVSPAASPSPDKANLGRNFLAFGAGAIVVAKTSDSESSDQGARQLIDESSFGWVTSQNQIENQSVTLELPARTTLKTIVIDTGQPTYYDGRGAKDILVEMSDTSATDGFQTILETTLKDSKNKTGENNQTFSVSKEITGRYLRYTAKNNYGSPERIYTGEIYGYGDQEPRAAIANISGTYKIPWLGELHIKQEGNSILGCYVYAPISGLIEGTIDGRNVSLVTTLDGKKDQFGSLNFVDNNNKILSTWWGFGTGKKAYDRFSEGKKVSDKIGNCPSFPDLDGAKDTAKTQLEQSLEKTGRAVLYGINFDFNSDVIRPESKPILEKLIAILKEKPDWKIKIEGHTDNIGGEAFNQTLSEKRAASVKNYLTNAGIDQSRLETIGKGLSNPVSTNDTEAGRAQNRRVEVVKE